MILILLAAGSSGQEDTGCVFKGCKCDHPVAVDDQIDVECMLDEASGFDFPERVDKKFRKIGEIFFKVRIFTFFPRPPLSFFFLFKEVGRT